MLCYGSSAASRHSECATTGRYGGSVATKLKIKLEKAHDPNTNTIGEVFESLAGGGEELEVSGVIARVDLSSRFQLAPGKYEYRFVINGGAGKFTVQVLQRKPKKVLASGEFDADEGVNRKLEFEVKK